MNTASSGFVVALGERHVRRSRHTLAVVLCYETKGLWRTFALAALSLVRLKGF